MTAFFTIAGVVVTILGIIAIAIISGIYIAVRFFGVVVRFGFFRDEDGGGARIAYSHD